MILRGYSLGALGWGTSAAVPPASGRVIYVDPAHKPNWIPAGATIIYRSPSASGIPNPAAVAVQPLPPQPSLPELIPQYTAAVEPYQGLQRPVEIPIEQAASAAQTAPELKPAEGGSLLPIIAAIILAIVAGN